MSEYILSNHTNLAAMLKFAAHKVKEVEQNITECQAAIEYYRAEQAIHQDFLDKYPSEAQPHGR